MKLASFSVAVRTVSASGRIGLRAAGLAGAHDRRGGVLVHALGPDHLNVDQAGVGSCWTYSSRVSAPAMQPTYWARVVAGGVVHVGVGDHV
jgi:hypothetical protein